MEVKERVGGSGESGRAGSGRGGEGRGESGRRGKKGEEGIMSGEVEHIERNAC